MPYIDLPDPVIVDNKNKVEKIQRSRNAARSLETKV